MTIVREIAQAKLEERSLEAYAEIHIVCASGASEADSLLASIRKKLDENGLHSFEVDGNACQILNAEVRHHDALFGKNGKSINNHTFCLYIGVNKADLDENKFLSGLSKLFNSEELTVAINRHVSRPNNSTIRADYTNTFSFVI